ncbi:MAG: DUF502 domain-containing protein [Planctomycetota bacterium]|jgi:uncharacterized membrane protein
MELIKRWFLSGLPLAATIGILAWAFIQLDGVLAVPQRALFKYCTSKEMTIPGLGIVVILVGVLLLGFLVSSFLTRWLVAIPGRIFERLPLVKLVYSSIRDLFDAFVGDKKSFDRPVLVRPMGGSDFRVLGFMTNEDLSGLGIRDEVAVYLPQSYNFAGNLIVVPRDAVTPLEVESGEAMTFIVSGGVSSKRPEGLPEPAEAG